MPYDARYTPDAAVVGFAFEAQSGTHAFASSRRLPFRTKPNSLAYVPRDCDVASTSDGGGEYLTIKLAPGKPERRQPAHRFNDFVHPAAIGAAQALRAALLRGGGADPLMLEACVATLHGVVVDVLGGHDVNPRAARWMTARRLKRVDDIIEERMDGPLTVGEVAASLELSAGFFSRAFKAAVGKSPHDYIVDRRVSRARDLLRHSPLGLAEIAAASGFASHGHMTTQFRRRLGVTPSGLRDQP